MQYRLFVVGPLLTNCYVLWDESTLEGYIIDPGGNNLNEVIDFIKSRNINLKYILATHGHFDHIMGVQSIKARFDGVKFLIHKDDERLVFRSKELAEYFNIPEDFEVPVIDGYISEGKIDEIEVIHTPGHTMGSVCFLVDNKFLFTGDTLFKGTVGRVDLGGNAEKLFESLEKLKGLDDRLIVLPGHGESSTLGEEKNNNPFLNGTLTLQDIAS
ncbi:MAG: MBL fold metallo-hydrolase [Sulfolobaceae archaeon]|nr:MBL fold metallo-hydrolase [Sulfolobaceae archaeon]